MPSNKHGLHRRSAARHLNPSLWIAFMTQWRVIHALIIREIHTRYGRDNIGFLWLIVEPAAVCIVVPIFFTVMHPSTHGMQATEFVATGYIPLLMWRFSMGRSTKAFSANASLLYHQLVTPLDIIIARTTLEVLGTLLSGSIVFFGAIFLGHAHWPEDWSKVFLGIFFVIFVSYDFAIIFATLTEMTKFLERIMIGVTYFAIPWSGAFIMIDWIPPHYRWLLESSPMANAIELMRFGVFGLKIVPHYSIIYTFSVCIVLLILGLFITRKVRRYITV